MKLYCINNLKKGRNTAGSKAPADCFKIAQKAGFEEIVFYEPKKYSNIMITRFFAFFTGIKNWRHLIKTAEPSSIVILQHPNEGIMVANRCIDQCKKKKKLKFVALIHDLDSLRKSLVSNSRSLDQRNIEADEVLLRKCDYIICHNESMKKYLIERGFSPEKLVSLGIFDYLHESPLPDDRKKEKSVVIAGNLLRNKCEYLYKLIEKEDLDITLHLFGPNYSGKEKYSHIIYYGQCSPDELPSKLKGSFGLVWDGTEIDTCAGNSGEYLRFNNPHKCSLFLASNIPVIIWKKAALAEFVEKNKVGICVDSLQEISEKIDAMTEKEYFEILQNVKRIGKELRKGKYLTDAILKIKDINPA